MHFITFITLEVDIRGGWVRKGDLTLSADLILSLEDTGTFWIETAPKARIGKLIYQLGKQGTSTDRVVIFVDYMSAYQELKKLSQSR